MTQPKISIITAGYNSAATIRDTLQCIADQTYLNIEHIIIDGASKDDTLKIVGEFPHVAKVISESDKGIYDAMNKGIKAATGDIIAILNSDDFYENNSVIEKVVLTMQEKKVQTLYGDLVFVKPNKTKEIVRYWRTKPQSSRSWKRGWMPPHPTFFVRSEIYKKYGDFNLDLKSAADYEFMLRVLYKHKESTFYLPEVLVRMRMGGQSNATIRNRWKANREDAEAWKINDLDMPFYTPFLKPLRKLNQYFVR